MIITDALQQITFDPDSTQSSQFSGEFMLQLINIHAKWKVKVSLFSSIIMITHQGILDKINLQISFVLTFYKYLPLLVQLILNQKSFIICYPLKLFASYLNKLSHDIIENHVELLKNFWYLGKFNHE